MRRIALLWTVLAAAVLAGSAHADVAIRQIDASRYPDLRIRVHAPPSADLAVRVNGRRPRDLERTNLGLQQAVVVAIDRSRSMAGQPAAAAVGAARGFLLTKPRGDRIEIVAFGHNAVALTGLEIATIDGDTALRTMSVDARKGTALFDAVVIGSEDLGQQPVVGRTLILLTDGGDLGSEANLRAAIDSARRNNVAVYGIGLGSADLRALRALAGATGGRVYESASLSTLSTIYARIRNELRQTWLLELPISDRPGDKVKVTVASGSEATSRMLAIPGGSASGGSSAIPSVFLGGAGQMIFAWLAGLLIAASLVFAFRRPRADKVKQRLRQIERDTDEEPFKKRMLRSLEGSFSASEARLSGLRMWTRIEAIRARSNVRLRTVHLAYIAVAGATLAGLVGAAGSLGPLLTLLLIAMAFIAPFVVVNILAKRRANALDAQLPDLLAAIASSLRAGHGLKHALESIIDTTKAPANEEFARVLSEARLGRPLDEAMLAMCERMGSEDLGYVAAAVRVQSHVGGSLAGLFDMVSETIRVRQRHARRVRALTATGRASATVLTALPIALALLLTLIDHTYLSPLFQTSIGRTLVVLSIISMTIGGLILRKVVAVPA